ncbi:MAG: hypothetical protein M3R63_19340 [Actinomycetota bacterium]|nr:hypothetical protein [Actinomycetota bacterium]
MPRLMTPTFTARVLDAFEATLHVRAHDGTHLLDYGPWSIIRDRTVDSGARHEGCCRICPLWDQAALRRRGRGPVIGHLACLPGRSRSLRAACRPDIHLAYGELGRGHRAGGAFPSARDRPRHGGQDEEQAGD